ncbi:TPA: hypothetical protein LUC54_003317 [Acinetobacter baumannii]|uniref:Peptidase n=2 Tax=Acinetobacter baumannii (strain ATCC 19606 / DSM 30007 / JCM 6841 / CCUG 19606 / CIP 70.34 / NBRC 109757 / NCIMB 12457 / NCTC 12156 / 81) TaxID=575584 RepID=D0CFP2_ACIB2|nr:hypothetical protein [Acinetobacter baumannii]ARN31377.1 hypothetical protein A4U85_11710 [Acinetobacter baumannii]EEX01793.1 hypothetical protein HMPREF0010_03572 [Acinetobacter baumannii ATCC 19606 = CIP 70.34 = JCM 6841]EME54764.1 hypothetical protein G347_12893 [Acinetobacter baumannii MSP4-16]ENW72410.1 hypothetical protein F911_03823 [Acinetobacter baumannii ATCC 19606 = CIP 70.34 = JCM 6841]KFC03584.1 hypothetical protein DJ41_2185 [Acinetobacter baumannii ATCC 19606 = CIP 70.34 = JC
MSEVTTTTTATDAATTATTTDTPAANTTATETGGGNPATTQVETTPTTSTTTTENTETKPEVLLGGEEPPAEQPIQYTDFTMPEGYSLNPEDSKTLQELGQQFKMPQEAVQKLVDLGVQMQQRQAQEQQKVIASWVDAAKADPEYGGEKLKENLLTAQRAFSLPRGAEISKILFKSGLGNHPAVIGFMTEVGKLLEGDNMTHGKGTNTANVAPAAVWYDKS